MMKGVVMDIKTVFPTQFMENKYKVSECKKSSADREPIEREFSTFDIKKRKKLQETDNNTDKEKEVMCEKSLNEAELNVSNFLENIENQRSLNSKIK